MKIPFKPTALLLLPLSLLLTHCGHSGSSDPAPSGGGSSSNASPQTSTPSPQATINQTSDVVQFSESYFGGQRSFKYEIHHNGCSTGQHEIKGFFEFCSLLSSEKANNFCSSNSRRNLFKAHLCPGDFSDHQEPNSPAIIDLIQERKMHAGKALFEVIKNDVEDNLRQSMKSAEFTSINCTQSISEAMDHRKLNGIALVRGSNILSFRAPDFKYADGSNSASEKPYVHIECASTLSMPLRMTKAPVHVLKQGEIAKQKILTSVTGALLQSDEFLISCAPNIAHAIAQQRSGLSLLGNSTLVVVDDMGKDQIFTCEEGMH